MLGRCSRKKPRARDVVRDSGAGGVAVASQMWNGMMVAWAIVVWTLAGTTHRLTARYGVRHGGVARATRRRGGAA
jgi:hypothetical protein